MVARERHVGVKRAVQDLAAYVEASAAVKHDGLLPTPMGIFGHGLARPRHEQEPGQQTGRVGSDHLFSTFTVSTSMGGLGTAVCEIPSWLPR